MLNRAKFREFIPSGGTYKGAAQMSFQSPEGKIWGTGTVSPQPDGHVTVRIDVESYSIPPEYRDLLMPFLEGAPPETTPEGRTTFRIGAKQKEKMGSLEIETSDGHFRSTRALVGQSHFDIFGATKPWLEVIPYGLEFSIGHIDSEEIWCMPLIGGLAEFQRCANACWIDGRIPYIHFRADDYDCGLVIFDPKDEMQGLEYSAAVFGMIGNRPHGSAEEVSALIPWGLLAALDFASGSDVRAPWLELRAYDGTLQRRIHLRFGGNAAETGFATFSKFDSATPESGIAEFLIRFFEMTQEQRRALTPTMSLIRRGAPGSATIDESITNLIKALEATCRRHKLGRVNLEEKLDYSNSQAVLPILLDARENLKQVRRQCKDDGRLDQLAILDKIISRQANVAGDELDFGIAVSELLRKFGLSDGEAMDGYYSKLRNGTTWDGLLSSIRGEVIHEGSIHVDGRPEIVSWFQFARHLHDICKRVLLLEIGYKGTYAPSNVLWQGTYKLDRITPSTTTEQLGYSVPPTRI